MKLIKKSRPDPKNPSTTIVEFVPEPEPKTGRVKTLCSECHKPISFHPGYVLTGNEMCTHCKAAEEKEALAEIKSRIHVICCDCGKPFFIKRVEANALEEKGFALYKRCYDCRRKRRESKNEK